MKNKEKITFRLFISDNNVLKLENIEISEKGLNAIDAETNEVVRLTVTENVENVEKFNLHNIRITEIEKLSPNISLEYMTMLKQKTVKEIVNFIYDDW